MEPRIPPKFVPTLTEVAPQEAEAAEERARVDTPSLPPGESRREAVNLVDAHASASPGDVDIASLPTHAGWAQSMDEGATYVPQDGVDHASVAFAPAETQGLGNGTVSPSMPAGNSAITHVSGQLDGAPAAIRAREAAAASLVVSAAETAQELEDAITRRVLKRVQETLDARLSSAVLLVVEQQTALLQSSLQLQIDSTIREAIADAVAKVMNPQSESDEDFRPLDSTDGAH